MEFCRFPLTVKLVLRSLGQFFGRSVCLWLQRSQGSRVFFEKLAHLLAFVVKVGVVTAEASQSKEVRKWMAFFTCCG